MTSVKQRATDEERDNAQKHVSGPSQPSREPPCAQSACDFTKYTLTSPTYNYTMGTHETTSNPGKRFKELGQNTTRQGKLMYIERII